ncbi:MAG TPA: (4Fe-4S)-binding protein [Flavipsychrobacter sp.]|nr:(4Fe-4S)-binding protein [Flavipsychrobacter sp.]
MKDITKHYSNGDITVVWKPGQCAHSALCWKGLTNVFNPKHRPWIKMNGAWTAEIIAQVEQCPSGALSYFRNAATENVFDLTSKVETKVEVTSNGPLIIHGGITVKHKDGSETQHNSVIAICRCGASGNKPYCDGSHVRINFKDE